jgi:hypothetical protein
MNDNKLVATLRNQLGNEYISITTAACSLHFVSLSQNNKTFLKNLLGIKCVSFFFTIFYQNTFHSGKIFCELHENHTVDVYAGTNVTLTIIRMCTQILVNSPVSNFTKIHAAVLTFLQADRQTTW